MSVIEIENILQFEHLIHNNVIIDWYASWCKPCSRISHYLTTYAMKYHVMVLKVNVEKHVKLSNKYKIKNLPTITLMINGEVSKQVVGTDPNEIKKLFRAIRVKSVL
jgi:thiol-disulfide isomerase/thioredoxin